MILAGRQLAGTLDGAPRVSGDDPASPTIATVQQRLRDVNDKWVTLTVQEVRIGGNGTGIKATVDADGSIHTAFANGTERHIAQIGRPGQIRIWNEDETGGEAYIPLAASKRSRSESILSAVATQFGGAFVKPQAFAEGAVVSSYMATAQPGAGVVGTTVNVTTDLTLNVQGISEGEALTMVRGELSHFAREIAAGVNA